MCCKVLEAASDKPIDKQRAKKKQGVGEEQDEIKVCTLD